MKKFILTQFDFPASFILNTVELRLLELPIILNFVLLKRQRSLDCALFCSKSLRRRLEYERSKKNTVYTREFPYFLNAVAASLVLYNRTEQLQGFFVCFITKKITRKFINFPSLIFKTNFIFQTHRGGLSVHLRSHKAR